MEKLLISLIGKHISECKYELDCELYEYEVFPTEGIIIIGDGTYAMYFDENDNFITWMKISE